MKKLFEDFKAVNLAEFEAQLIKDLRGEPLDSLTTEQEEGLFVKAYSHREEDIATNNLSGFKESNTWVIRHEFDGKASNAEILNGLSQGLTGIGLELKHPDNFKEQTKDVLFEHIHTDIRIPADQIHIKSSFDHHIQTRYNPIANHLKSGEPIENLESFKEYYENYKAHKSIWVEGAIYGDAGAGSVQELGNVLGQYNEYLNVLNDDHGISDLVQKSTIELSITENYFLNIAKFRAIRILIATLLKGYNYEGDKQPRIAAASSTRSLTLNDAHNNLLRGTTQAMSAILGGCDILTLKKRKLDDAKYDKVHERMLKNISLILAEEAYFDKVGDAGAGAYYIEKITNDLVQQSWIKFQTIEKGGGLIKAINANSIQSEIMKHRQKLINALNDKSKTLLGVNKYQNSMEKYHESRRESETKSTSLTPLTKLYLESHFTPLEA